MKRSKKFPYKARERAVRMAHGHRSDWPSLRRPLSLSPPRCVEVDSGVCDGVTFAPAQRVTERKRENKKLRRSNDMFKLTSAFLPSRGWVAA